MCSTGCIEYLFQIWQTLQTRPAAPPDPAAIEVVGARLLPWGDGSIEAGLAVVMVVVALRAWLRAAKRG